MMMLLRSRFCAVMMMLLATAIALFIATQYVHAMNESSQTDQKVIILDAGHGGEDGGASSAEGLLESEVNLQIVRILQKLFVFTGQEPVLTRNGEGSLSSPDAITLREKKVSDLKNRVTLINSYEDGILLSIHQNSLPGQPTVQGAQAFFNSIEPAESLADRIQDVFNNTINRGKGKFSRYMEDGVYLMKESCIPAVLLECGFLSNPQESSQLAQQGHQLNVAASIAAGYLEFTTDEDIL